MLAETVCAPPLADTAGVAATQFAVTFPDGPQRKTACTFVSPSGFTFPFRVAETPLRIVAALVTAVGVFVVKLLMVPE
jgi:hypothetical protein